MMWRYVPPIGPRISRAGFWLKRDRVYLARSLNLARDCDFDEKTVRVAEIEVCKPEDFSNEVGKAEWAVFDVIARALSGKEELSFQSALGSWLSAFTRVTYPIDKSSLTSIRNEEYERFKLLTWEAIRYSLKQLVTEAQAPPKSQPQSRRTREMIPYGFFEDVPYGHRNESSSEEGTTDEDTADEESVRPSSKEVVPPPRKKAVPSTSQQPEVVSKPKAARTEQLPNSWPDSQGGTTHSSHTRHSSGKPEPPPSSQPASRSTPQAKPKPKPTGVSTDTRSRDHTSAGRDRPNSVKDHNKRDHHTSSERDHHTRPTDRASSSSNNPK